jgi:hypothetical protein
LEINSMIWVKTNGLYIIALHIGQHILIANQVHHNQ